MPVAFPLCVVRSSRGAGTGFAFLGPRWIVTARHVVAGPSRPDAVRVTFHADPPLPGRIVFSHPRFDLAVIEVLADTGRAPLLPHDGVPPAGALVLVAYAPSTGETRQGRLRPLVVTVETYERSARHRDGHAEVLYKFPAPEIGPGCSGAPLLVPGGGVVGVVVDSITLGGQHVMRATSIAPLVDAAPFAHPGDAR
jgi:S1-C subfamily serine protease